MIFPTSGDFQTHLLGVVADHERLPHTAAVSAGDDRGVARGEKGEEPAAQRAVQQAQCPRAGLRNFIEK